jgi:hypothetical protein
VAFFFADEQLDRANGHPFTDAEIRATAKSVWEWTERGNNFVGRGRAIVVSHVEFDAIAALGPDHVEFDAIAALGPDAYFLEQYLRRHHWGREFVVANDMRFAIPGGEWSLKRIQAARKALIDAKRIIETRGASSFQGPAWYVWAKVSEN